MGIVFVQHWVLRGNIPLLDGCLSRVGQCIEPGCRWWNFRNCRGVLFATHHIALLVGTLFDKRLSLISSRMRQWLWIWWVHLGSMLLIRVRLSSWQIARGVWSPGLFRLTALVLHLVLGTFSAHEVVIVHLNPQVCHFVSFKQHRLFCLVFYMMINL